MKEVSEKLKNCKKIGGKVLILKKKFEGFTLLSEGIPRQDCQSRFSAIVYLYI